MWKHSYPEVWKPVVGFEKLYYVSNHGHVHSIRQDRQIKCHASGRNKHRKIHLRKNGRSHLRYVHHLVLEAFVGPRPEGMVCCHYDGNAENNVLKNLRWGTILDNAADERRLNNHHNGKKTHCKWGHEFSAENTIGTKRGRRCRKCANRACSEYGYKRRAAKKLAEQAS